MMAFRAVSLKRPLAALGAAALASLALPPTGLVVAAFGLAIPFFWLAQAETRREAFGLGFATGFGWFGVSLYWISQAFVTSGGGHVLLIPFAALGLPALLGLFWGAAFLMAMLARQPVARVLLGVAFLSLAEYARGTVLSGFPWNAPGMMVVNTEISLMAAAGLGLWGVTLLALLFAVLPALLLLSARSQAAAVIAVLVLTGVLAERHGNRLAINATATGMTVRLVQPNIPQREKWQRDQRPQHFNRLISLSRQPSSRQLDLIVWPETAFAGALEAEGGVLRSVTQAASQGTTPLVLGMLRVVKDGRVRIYNSMAVAEPDGRITRPYDKNHLVPFGEYAPLRRFLPFVDAIAGPYDFEPGRDRDALVSARRDGRPVRLLPLICYEVIFPSAVRRSWQESRPDLLITLTNDAWFGDTIGPRQHLAMARMRSVELGIPMIRVANTGISAAIDSHGRITHRINYGEQGFADALVSGSITTPYRRFGDSLFFVLAGLVIVVAGANQVLTAKNPRR